MTELNLQVEVDINVHETKGQTKKLSFIEAVTNTFIGFIISWFATTFFLYHVLNIKMTFNELWWYTWFMTAISIARGYVLRRLFNSEFWKKYAKRKN